MGGSKHPVRKSVESERIVVRPGHGKGECFTEPLKIDQGRACIDPDCLIAIEQFPGVTGRARKPKYYIFLPRVRVDETLVARKTHRQPIRVLWVGPIGNKPEGPEVGVFSQERSVCEGKFRLLECQKPRVRQKLTALCQVVKTTTLVISPILRQPGDRFWPLNRWNLQSMRQGEEQNPQRAQNSKN